MKKLSIVEKAKAYDNVRDKITIRFGSNIAKEIFSEYEESEDELTWLKRFIKEEIDYLYFDIRDSEDRVKLKNLQSSLAWLEKQGNLMKALQISNAKIGELIEENYYLKEQLEKQGKNNMGISEATKQKLEDNLNKALEKETQESCNKFLDEQSGQKTTTEMKTPEESLGIDSDTYNKIVDGCVYGEQNPAWSEEDIELLDNTIKFIEDRVAATSPSLRTYSPTLTGKEIPFLKALKDRVQPKQEWSEEDEKILNLIIARLHSHPSVEVEEYGKDYHWLKSLKDRYVWKPSDEQMLAINTAINVLGKGTINGKYLIGLHEQLKKLREE